MARLPVDVLGALREAPVLSLLPAATLAALARATRVVELKNRDVLWREGDRATALGLVLFGRVAVERARRRPVVVDIVGAGQFVGEVGFALGARYAFDVRCLRAARVALVPSRQLRAALTANADASASLSVGLAQQVLRLSRRVETLSAGSVGQRLARVLLGLAERFGTPFPGGVLLPVRLRREDLAALGATTVESASRQVSAWKRSGVVTPQPAGFLIKDLEALRRLGDESTVAT